MDMMGGIANTVTQRAHRAGAPRLLHPPHAQHWPVTEPRMHSRLHAPRRGAPAGAAWVRAVLLAAAAVGGALPWAGSAAHAQAAPEQERVEPAVISIEVTQQRVDWYSPWQGTRPETAAGSGFLIGRGRIMTNAHVVSDARQIIVRRDGDHQSYFAELEFIAHDADLATLRVADPAFARGVKPLQLGGLPSLRSRVRTYGYPAGGEKISRTEGVVSRVEFVTYLHTGADQHLAVQTDSAINPGNSGGPVVQEGKVIGVAFQTSTRLNDVGFFIPTPVIKRFLADVKDGHYDGYGDLGIVTSNLINPVYRDYLGLKADGRGVLVDRVLHGSSGDGVLRAGDVVLAIDDVPVLSDGTIDSGGYSFSFQQVVEQKLLGEPVRVAVWRERKRQVLQLPLKRYTEADRMRARFDAPAPYFVYAGLVFMELNREYLRTFGNYWENADKHLLYKHFYAFLEENQAFEGAVVLARILPHRINSAYAYLVNTQVQSLNGVPIHALRDLEAGLKAGTGRYHRIVLAPGDLQLVLERQEATQSHQEIMGLYGIQQDRYLP
jgi:S1-C subfamily serine protease